jgi:hypothetical protein
MIRMFLSAALVAGLHAAAAAEPAPLHGSASATDRKAYAHDRAPLMLRWIAEQTDYSVDEVVPRFQFVPARTIVLAVRSDQALAYFDDGMIVLRDDFRPGHDDAMMLHELVHLVQWENGAFDRMSRCALELEAYELQIEWATRNSGHIPGTMWMASLRMCVREGG